VYLDAESGVYVVNLRRVVAILVLLGLAIGAWAWARHDELADVPVPPVQPQPEIGPGPAVDPTPPPAPDAGAGSDTSHDAALVARRATLHAARRTCRLPPLDEFVLEQELLVRETEDPALKGRHLHVLAEACLERIYCRNAHRGMTPGEALYARVPPAVADDVEDGLQALADARALGVELGDGYRVEAGLRTSLITGKLSAMSMKSKVTAAFKRATELDGENPRLHVGLGCRKLFAPRYLGQDLDKAMEHFVYACFKLPQDERPRIFASMTAYLTGDSDGALSWAEKAAALNENSAFAKAVLQRLKNGERDPFGRDL
jgi:hypothetical protein